MESRRDRLFMEWILDKQGNEILKRPFTALARVMTLFI